MRVIISGCRNYKNWQEFKGLCEKEMVAFQYEHVVPKSDVEIIHGGAKGVDTMASWFAQNNKIKMSEFPANWTDFNEPLVIEKYNSSGQKYNAAAGGNRNQRMLDYALKDKCPILLAFWDKKSPGTKNMINIAKKAGIQVKIVKIAP